jgi:DNA-binding LacI/PurR family transcriptional regulator
VPQRDIQVVSCDNSETWLGHLDTTRPATIDLGLAEIARTAVGRLITRIEHPDEPILRLVINPRLVLPPS